MVRAPSLQDGVTVQSLQPSTRARGAFRPATPTTTCCAYGKWYSPTPVPLPLSAGSVWYDSPRPLAPGLYATGCANSGCENAHSAPFLNTSDDHQSLFGTAPG